MSSLPAFASTGPQGHRGRMRERLLSRGADNMADYEILEMLLFLGIPRRDTKPLAKELINRFGSLQAVLGAEPELLGASGGLGAEVVSVLRLPDQAASRLALAEERVRPVLNNWDRLLSYFETALQGAVPGDLRMLLLDNRNRLLADEPLSDVPLSDQPVSDAPLSAALLAGAPDQLAAVLARRALQLHATALVLVRVLGDAPLDKTQPKREAALAAGLAEAIAPLAIVLHDHMLVGTTTWVSLRQKNLL